MNLPQLSFQCVAYQEKDGTYTGVCLNLDIVEEGHSTIQAAVESINEAITTHLQALSQLNFPEELLNRPAPKKYWKKWEQLISHASTTANQETPTKTRYKAPWYMFQRGTSEFKLTHGNLSSS